MAFDGKAFGEEMVQIVRGFVEREAAAIRSELERENAVLREANAALAARLEAVEARDIAAELRPEIEAVGRAVAALPGPPDLSGFATKTEVEEVRAAIPALPEAPDLSGFVTRDDLDAVRAAIPPPPDLAGFVTMDEVRAAIPDDPDLSEFATKAEVEEVRSAIPALPDAPDLSGFATKDDVAEAVAAIRIPEAIKGEDADPEAVAAIVVERIEGRLADADRRIDARLAEVKDGKDGMLPLVEEWRDVVHYRGSVVTHGGSLWQATADTGREPPHADWLCLAAAGQDGRTPEFVGTYTEGEEYRRLDVAALNGGSFVALRDNPGPCPGDGWQLVASRGKPGQAIKGDKGDKGDPGMDAAEIAGVYRDGEEIVITTAAGREFRA